MKIACVAVIDQNNTPLYLKSTRPDGGLKFPFIVHTSLDVVDEKMDSPDLYLGLLTPADEYNVYGYLTNTKTKFIAVIDETGSGTKIKTVFKQLHSLYIDTICNPFYNPSTPISTPSFERKVMAIIDAASS
eukprot:CFRG1534T1